MAGLYRRRGSQPFARDHDCDYARPPRRRADASDDGAV